MDRGQALRFLQALYAVAPRNLGLYFQIRCLDPRGGAPPFARSYGFTEADAGLSAAERFNAAGRHVYVGVNPRFRPGGRNIDVDGVVALPLDYDSNDLAGDAGAKLRALGLRCGLSIQSGRGWHFYVLLDSYERRVDLAQDLGRRLCRYTGSDNVHARSHVMRVPGTVNWKPQVGGVMAKLITCEPSWRYSLDQILAKLDAAGVPAVSRRVPRTPRAVTATTTPAVDALDWGDLDDEDAARQKAMFSFLPERYQRLSNDGVPRGQRSEAAMGVCRMLANVGASEDEIATFFLLRPRGIGAVVTEKGLGWLDRTIAALDREQSLTEARPEALSSVRLLGVSKPLYLDRAELHLTVEDGPFTGSAFTGGLDLASRRGRDPWRFCFMAFGHDPAAVGDIDALRALVGKRAHVVLAREKFLNVTWWWPKARCSSLSPLCA